MDAAGKKPAVAFGSTIPVASDDAFGCEVENLDGYLGPGDSLRPIGRLKACYALCWYG